MFLNKIIIAMIKSFIALNVQHIILLFEKKNLYKNMETIHKDIKKKQKFRDNSLNCP